jgi:hypothetical protein
MLHEILRIHTYIHTYIKYAYFASNLSVVARVTAHENRCDDFVIKVSTGQFKSSMDF